MADLGDFLQKSPNFINPQYITPEQLKNNRELGMALLKRAGEPLPHTRPAGILASGLDALTGSLVRNNADQMQSQAASQNAAMLGQYYQQMHDQGPRGVDPRLAGAIAANPMAAPETRVQTGGIYTPERITDTQGRPAYVAPAGPVSPPPLNGPPGSFSTGAPGSMSAGDTSTSGIVQGPPIAPAAPQGAYRMPPPQAMQEWRNSAPRQPGVPPLGAPSPAPVSPAPPPIPQGDSFDQRLQPLDRLAKFGREQKFQREQNEAVANVAKQDITASADAPAIKRVAGVMLDDLHAHGDKMTFGPTAQWSNEVKRVAANYAPGLFTKKDMEDLASADSFDKMSAQLTTMLTKSSGTDAQLFNSMKSVPGAHNSKEGAEALLKMTLQVADQQQALREYASKAQNSAQYEAFRHDFFQKNPIINPITKNPLSQDVADQRSAPSYEKTATNPTTGEKIGLVNGKWVPIR